MGSIPIPGDSVTLNGSDLISQSKEAQEALRTELKEVLDQLTYTLEDSEFLGSEVGLSLSPEFIDIDSDGDYDLFIGEYNGKMSVIDFKGSTRNKRKEDIDNYFLQATAYAIMWQERTGIKIDNIAILMSCEDGTVSIFESNPMKHTRGLFECIQDYKKTLV